MAIKKKRNKKSKSRLYVFGIALTLIAFALYFLLDLQSKIAMSVIQTHTIDLGEIKKTINKDIVIVRKSVPIVSGRDWIAY